jgi:hypothetical protein
MLLAAAEVQLPLEALYFIAAKRNLQKRRNGLPPPQTQTPPSPSLDTRRKQTLKPDLLEGANSSGLGFLPPRVWRRLEEARRVTPGERQKKGIEKSICVYTSVIAILHGSLYDGFVSSAVMSFQCCFFCNLYKASFGGLPSHRCELEQQLTVTTYNAT